MIYRQKDILTMMDKLGAIYLAFNKLPDINPIDRQKIKSDLDVCIKLVNRGENETLGEDEGRER